MSGDTKSSKDTAISQSQAGIGHDGHDVLRTLSHEIRTPLNNIIGFADMMSGEMLGPMSHPQYREYAEDIRKSGQSILDLLNDLLDGSRFESLAESAEHHANIIDLAPDMIIICDDKGVIRTLNPAGCAILAIAADAAKGASLKDYVHPNFRGLIEDGFAELTRETRRVAMKFMANDGREVDADVAATIYETPHDDISGEVMIVARDVTERNRALREMTEREEFLRTIMGATVDGLVTINEMGIVETANPAAETIFGYNKGGLIGEKVANLVPDARGRRQSDSKAVLQTLEADGAASDRRELTGMRRDGSTFPLELSLSDFVLRERAHYIAVVRDITERKRAEDKLKFLATRDPLTHLPNRYMFNERLRESTGHADELGAKTAVLFIDLDNFKHINDAMGHVVGDVVLQLAGRRLESCVRERDMVARLSGDEFVVILESVNDEDEVKAVATRMLRQLDQPFHVDGKELYSSGSIGVIIYPDNCGDVDDLLKNVYTASHHAKKQGRNNFQFYSSSLSANALRRMSLEHGLRHALENNEFHLAYQPKVDLSTGRIIGAEALARWTNPELGPVSPVEFVPVAEQTGLIVEIGDWILQTACREAKLWTDKGLKDVSVAVNLSARQFQQKALCQRVGQILEESGLPARLLDLELTESMLVDNAEKTIEILKSLKALGMSLSIDDFGTGYSSLSYLTKFPLDALKVDRSFVTGLPDNPDAVTMAKAIVHMAQNLGLKVIAEGVENERQSTFLHGLGSDIGQGYLYSRPVPFEDFVRLAGGNVMPFPIDQVRRPSV